MIDASNILILLIIIFALISGISITGVFAHIGWGFSKKQSVIIAPFFFALILFPPILVGYFLIHQSNICCLGIFYLGWVLIWGVYIYSTMVTALRKRQQ